MTTKVARAAKTYRFPVVVEQDKDGFVAFCPGLQGCYTQGRTYEDVLAGIKDAIRLHVADRRASGEQIPQSRGVSLTDVEISL